MKNAMKKLMSLVLVAMILVSAVPFAASANTDPCAFWIELKLDGNHIDSQTVSVPVGTTMDEATVKQYAQSIYGEYFGDGYTYVGGYAMGGQAGVDGYIGAGIKFETKVVETEPAETEPVETEPTAYDISIDVDGEMKALTQKVSVTYEEVLQMVGVKASDVDYIVYEGEAVEGTRFLDAGYTIKLAGATRVFVFTEAKAEAKPEAKPENKPADKENTTGAEGYYKFSGEVELWIYLNGSKKVVDIKDGIAADGKVNIPEVKSVVKYYYNAIDGDTGIVVDGIYPQMGNWVLPYAKDESVEVVNGLYDAANNNDVVALKVVISNAKLASNSSSKADSSNPKTGDQIHLAVAGMAVTASALALGFYFTKKRAF